MKFEQLTAIPDKYRDPLDIESGKVEKFYYTTKGLREEEYQKYCYVYLPYGYDSSKPYDIIYHLHGGGEVADRALMKGSEPTYKKYMFDNMIKDGLSKPFIWVSVEWYEDNMKPLPLPQDQEFERINYQFHKELVNDVIPQVEASYHTYANLNPTKEALLSSREHRALAGWSMGSITTWYTCLSEDMKYFRYFNFESGHLAWEQITHTAEEGGVGAGNDPKEAVRILKEKMQEKGIGKEDFIFYITTGTDDFGGVALRNQAYEMMKDEDYFLFDGDEPNCVFLEWEGGQHHTEWRRIYQYNAVKTFFENK